MRPFASNRLLQIIMDLLRLNSGDGKAFSVSPLSLRDITVELWDLRNLAQKPLAYEIQTAIKLSIFSKITISSLGKQIAMCNCTSWLCLSCSPGPSVEMTSIWTSHLSGLTLLSVLLVSPARRDHSFLLTLVSFVLCQTTSHRQGTTDPGEPWEQKSPGGVICNSEFSGQLPRLCSDFWCSLEFSHYITKRSTIKY